jgi:zinc/manganese transport system substrate-binding protein
MRRSLIPLLALALVAAGCGDGGGATGDRTLVITTTSILADVVADLAGDAATVESIMPNGADPHDFEASARDIARLRDADLVVANGLGLEEQLTAVLDRAEGDGVAVLRVAPAVDPLPFAEIPGHDDEHAGDLDPHIWFDPIRMAAAVRLVADRMDEIDPQGGWGGRADGVVADLETLDAEIREIVSVVPEDRRLLVTNHEVLGYFAARYDFRVVGVVVPGGSTLAEPSSRDLADLVAAIRDTGVPAIFTETTDSSALAESVADEIGRPIEVVELHTAALGDPGSEAATYIGMMRTNARAIAAALNG